MPSEIKLQCVKTPDKGRGMVSQFDIPQASLIHAEEPYAVVCTYFIVGFIIDFILF